jgi:tetrapyrrole methylase family protein / MazG family protein
MLTMTQTQLNPKPTTPVTVDLHRLLSAGGVDPMQGYQCVPAGYLAQSYHPQLETNLPALITTITTPEVLVKVVQTLANAYPQNHAVTLFWLKAKDALTTEQIPLATVGSQPQPELPIALFVPPLPQFSSFSALQEIVAHLRSPDGCPWDRAQTLASMRQDLLSECAEVMEAIDAEASGGDNGRHIAEELGDLLMGVILMVQIATDGGRFQLHDAVYSIVTKLRRRHPHVFGDVVVEGVQNVLTNWDAIKAQEKAAKGITTSHPLDGVPAALPALEKARQLQSKAAKAGLLDRAALAAANPALIGLLPDSPDEAALGALLWQLVAVAHGAGLNPEDALRSYTVHYRQAQGAV